MTELRWEDRGMRGYCVDSTGKVRGQIFYLFVKEAYDAEVEGAAGVFVRVGTYVSSDDARRAVERAIEVAAQTKAQENATHE